MPNDKIISFRHAITLLTIILCGVVLQAQNLTVLHTFTGGADGATPATGVIMDRAGNLYGTAGDGALGYGVAFKLKPHGSSWLFTTLHQFAAGNDGAYPNAPLFFF